MHALREDELFALLRGVGLDDADAAERFGQAAGDFGVDLAAFAEQRTQPLERQRHAAAEDRQRDDRGERQAPVQIEQVRERGDRGDDAAGELDEAGADEIPDPFGVVHDAREQLARLRRVEVADRQPGDVLLDLPPHVGDRALRRHAQHLRQRERRDRLHERRRAGRERQRHQQIRAPLSGDIVDEVLGGGRQHETGQAVDEHQGQAEPDPPAARPDELARLAPDRRGIELFLGFLVAIGGNRRRRGASPPARAFRSGQAEPAPESRGHVLV